MCDPDIQRNYIRLITEKFFKITTIATKHLIQANFDDLKKKSYNLNVYHVISVINKKFYYIEKLESNHYQKNSDILIF